jgi:hypothetical protein
VKEVTAELGYLRQNQETIIAKRCLEQRRQVIAEQEQRHSHIICIASWVGMMADRAVERVEEIKAAEAREKERRLREFQLLRSERAVWETQGAGASVARQTVEIAISRWVW